jgi:CRP-like cAMP-binding protein
MRKGMEMGADDYITKPFDDIELLNAVESRLKKAEMMKREVPATREGVTELLQNIHGIEDIAAISGRQQVRQLHKKDIIYSEGDSPAGLYLLTKGKAKVYKSHELGKDLILRMLHEGDFFGYLALLEGGTHAETAEAIEDGEVVIFPREDFFNLLEHSPVVMQQVIRMLSGSIADEHERLLLLAYSSVRKRTAEALLRLRLRFHDGTEQPFSMAIAREDLANMVGTATESLIRTLSDFREEGLVAVQGSTITVLDVSKLERMKN